MTLLDIAAARPDDPAVLDGTTRRTFGELLDRATRAGHVLRDELGLQAGDHVSMLMGNRVEFVELALGALLSGVWMTPINWHLTAGETGYIVGDSHSQALFADPRYETTAKEAAGAARVIVAGDELDALLAAADDAPFATDGPAGGSMLYTSGTTGQPKGVKRVRPLDLGAALIASALPGKTLGLDGGGPHLVTGPLYHAAPLGYASIDLHNGGAMVLMDQWDPAETLRLIMEHGIRNSHLVPTMMVRLLRLPDEVRAQFDPSSLHTVLHGAAPVAPPVKARMIEWWGDCIVEYWGTTEGGVFTLVGAQDWLERPGTVGKAIATYEVFAVDADGNRLPADEVGTLYCRNQLTTDVFEYHEAPEKTAGAHLAPGTFTMGDIGRVDADGYVFLSDRSANLIISGGVNIYPAEIEQVLIEHPAVADVGVFGIPDEEWGEQVKAAVQLRDGFVASPELEADIIAFTRQHLAGFKTPRTVDFEDELPRHPTGKLYTRLLRDKYWKRT
jgi:long-chain acyl-CoA synthetase